MPKALSEAAKLGGQEILLKGTASKGSVQGFAVTQEGKAGETAATITITEASAPVEQSAEVEPAPAAPAAEPALTAEQVQAMLSQALAPIQQDAAKKDEAIAAAEAEAEALRQQLATIEAEKQAAEQEAQAKAAEAEAQAQQLKEALQAQNAMENLGKLVGTTAPSQSQTIEVVGAGSEAYRRWENMLNNAPSKTVMSGGLAFEQKDKRGATDYFWKNVAEIRGGMEAIAKDAGLLQGAGTITNAATDKDCIPSSLFDYLVNFVRMNTDCDLIYHNFTRRIAVPGTAPRCQGNIPRYPYNEGPTAKDDRKLDCNTPIDTARQAIKETLVKFDICEYGLGKDANNAALAISECVAAYSMQNLEQLVARNLGRDYQRFVDLLIRCIYFGSTTVLYNGGGCVKDDPTTMEMGSVGTMSRAFLRSLRSHMKTKKIPTFDNGYYALVLNPNQIQYLLDELAAIQRYVEPASPNDMELISRILQTEQSDRMGGRVNGYKMTLDGFMIFETNAHSVGAAGDEGVQLEAFGAAADMHITETAFAFGPEAAGWASALPVELREGEINDFRRCRSWIWYSHEAFFPIDVNENIDTSVTPNIQTEECRVVQLRLARKPF